MFQVNPRALTAQPVWGVGLTEAAGLSANECLKGIPIFAFASERPLKGHLIYIPQQNVSNTSPCTYLFSYIVTLLGRFSFISSPKSIPPYPSYMASWALLPLLSPSSYHTDRFHTPVYGLRLTCLRLPLGTDFSSPFSLHVFQTLNQKKVPGTWQILSFRGHHREWLGGQGRKWEVGRGWGWGGTYLAYNSYRAIKTKWNKIKIECKFTKPLRFKLAIVRYVVGDFMSLVPLPSSVWNPLPLKTITLPLLNSSVRCESQDSKRNSRAVQVLSRLLQIEREKHFALCL